MCKEISTYGDLITDNKNFTFTAIVIEPGQTRIMVNPDEEDGLFGNEDRLIVLLCDDNKVIYEVGTRVRITFSGQVMLSYPAQVYAICIEVIDQDTIY